MSKVQELLKKEKDCFGKVYVDLIYAADNVSPFLDEDKKKERKYIVKLPVLKKYIELIETAELETEHTGIMGIFKDDKLLEPVNSYKRQNSEILNQLEKCSRCKCLNCSAQCRFDGCTGCRQGARIVSCDHKKINVYYHDNFTLDLVNDRTGRTNRYMVLATLQDAELNRKYIIIQNVSDKEDKYVLYYYPGLVEDKYGQISDEEEFDYVVSMYQSVDE